MSVELLTEISEKLDKLIRLQAMTVVRGEVTEQGKIALLDSLGFKTTEIAKMLNKSPENVGVVLTRIRKGGKKAEAPVAEIQVTGQLPLAAAPNDGGGSDGKTT